MNGFTAPFVLMGLTLTLLMWQGMPQAAEHPELKVFPAAKEGMDRFVIVLPREKREDERMVEIIPGKVMPTDGVNIVRLGSVLEPRTLEGWGYTYYEVTGSDVVMSTMMARPEGGQPVVDFVAGTPLLVPYNSRLPLVVYAPQGYEIRYWIWAAADNLLVADKN